MLSGNVLYSCFFFFSSCYSECFLHAKQHALCWLRSNTKTIFFFLKELRSSRGTQMGTQIITILWYKNFDKDRSQHTLCVEGLNGKNLKPSVLVRMCRDRPWEEAGLGCLHLFVALISYQRYSSLPKGCFSLSPIPVGLVKMCAVYPGQKLGLRGPSLGEDRQSPRQCQAAEWEKSLPESGRFLRI